MPDLFQIKDVDRRRYAERIRDFLPERIIDIHTHVWRKDLRETRPDGGRTAAWPARVADENPIEDHLASYRLLLPDMQVTPLMFTTLCSERELDGMNEYVARCAREHDLPALLFTTPSWSAEELGRRLEEGPYHGAKPYLSFAPEHLERDEITVFDFLPRHQLDVLNARRSVVILHLPREGRLRDPVNLEQLSAIEAEYPDLRVIVAHVGRAYCPSDVGDAFRVLGDTRRLCFDISANTNARVFEQLIEAVGPRRVLFGSDLPIARMRMRRLCENGMYVNVVPKGLYGDVSDDQHMREVGGPEADRLTFFFYEIIDAFRHAAEQAGLTRQDIDNVFYHNAARMLRLGGEE